MFGGGLYAERCPVCGAMYQTDGGDLACGNARCEATADEWHEEEAHLATTDTQRREQAQASVYAEVGL